MRTVFFVFVTPVSQPWFSLCSSTTVLLFLIFLGFLRQNIFILVCLQERGNGDWGLLSDGERGREATGEKKQRIYSCTYVGGAEEPFTLRAKLYGDAGEATGARRRGRLVFICHGSLLILMRERVCVTVDELAQINLV